MKLTNQEKQKIVSALEVQIASIYSNLNEINKRGDSHAEHYISAGFQSIEFNKQLIKKVLETINENN